MRIGGYVRVSTSEQADSGLGLEAQRAALERFAAGRGGELVTFTDAGCSGRKRSKRPALAAMLERVAAGDLAIVAVTKLDRLARRTLDALQIGAEIEKAGAEL